MKHIKKYQSKEIHTPHGNLIIEGPLSGMEIAKYDFNKQLNAFRPAYDQHEAIIEIADLPEGRMFIARLDDMIIGYVTLLYPDPLERWSWFFCREGSSTNSSSG